MPDAERDFAPAHGATDEWIPVSAPELAGREAEYVLDCVTSTWISSKGQYIERFEEGFRALGDFPFAVACNSGTSALHLALLALGIGPGDEVIVPTLTYVASANTVRYCGATVRFVDSLPDTWNLDPDAVERAITPRTRAIMPVHLYGQPAAMTRLEAIAQRHGVAIVEDAAEAHGARSAGRAVGGIGDVGVFSFYGNKIITTGEGGMVVTRDAELARRALLFRGQGQDFEQRYWFPVVGYNYRMTNVAAAIGLAQLETIAQKLARRREIGERYRQNLAGVPGISFQSGEGSEGSVHWLVGVLLPIEQAEERDAVAAELERRRIETRPFFYPVHTLPPYTADAGEDGFPAATALAARGLCLPTWNGLSDADIDRVSETLIQAL